MAVPDFQSLMLPVLTCVSEGEAKISDVIERIALQLNLSDADRDEMLPTGKQTRLTNRISWAKTYLKQAGLVEATKRAHYRITPRGLDVLNGRPVSINIAFLRQFPEFNDFQKRTSVSDAGGEAAMADARPGESSLSTPEEAIRTAFDSLNASLAQDMLDRIRSAPAFFFERLIVSLVLAMGYGGSSAEAGRAIGKSGDDGVDGVIDQDPLGLDRVYVQAKRYQQDSNIGPAAIRDFFGSLDMHKASKGLFVSTSGFTAAAAQTADKLGKRIVLIDGHALARLMIRYSVGCRVEDTLEIKRLDEEFFEI